MTAVNRGKIVAKEEKAFGKSMCIEIRECGKNLISNIPAAVVVNPFFAIGDLEKRAK